MDDKLTAAQAREAFEAALARELRDIENDLHNAHSKMGALEETARGVNGLSTFLKNQSKILDPMIEQFQEQVDDVPNKLSGTKAKKEPIAERTANPEQSQQIAAAREEAGL